jgi:hypothetical protein
LLSPLICQSEMMSPLVTYNYYKHEVAKQRLGVGDEEAF